MMRSSHCPGTKDSASFLQTFKDTVRHNFAKYGVLDDRVRFVKGLLKDTVPSLSRNIINTELAVLRVDGNFYDSHQDALYGLVPVGGHVIVDAIRSHPAVEQCWKDVQKDQGVTEELVPLMITAHTLK
jgi:cobalamin biosynthesis Co2+ chelatase CbiK